jgi:hypothetical protein
MAILAVVQQLSPWLLVAGTTFFGAAWYFIYQTFFHPLSHLPGPTSARYFGSWRNKRYWRGSWHDDVLELHRKYGRVVRIAPNEVAIVDAGAVKQIYGVGHATTKTPW